MTEAPPRVRAVAKVVAAESAPAAGQPAPKRRPGYLGTVHVVQLVLVETVALGIFAALTQNLVVAAVAAAAGALLILAATLRRDGRWWYERQTVGRQYRRRRGRPENPQSDPRLAALQWLAPGLATQDVGPDDGALVGVACDAAGWYGVIAVGAASTVRGDGDPEIPLDVLARAQDDADQPGVVLQVVTHSVPAPGLDMDSRHLAAHSYRELQQLAGPAPADRTTWIAVRLEARSRAEAGVAGEYDARHAPALLANLVRKVGRLLREASVPHRILTADELLDALTRACDLEAERGDGQPRPPHEEWTAWHSPRTAHTTFWLKDWPRITDAARWLETVSAIPSSSTTVSLVLARDGEQLAMRCLIRVAAPPDGLTALCEAVNREAGEAGAELFRLDGEHGPAVYASAPTGGGAT